MDQFKFGLPEERIRRKNIVRFTVHRDEKTMHIHAVTVPITQDGRLSAKEIMGNRKEMQNRQDRYADHMKNFGLERGKEVQEFLTKTPDNIMGECKTHWRKETNKPKLRQIRRF